MENLGHLGVGQQRLEVGRVVGGAVHLHQMGIAVAGRKLDQAKLVAAWQQPQRFGINGNRSAKVQSGGQITLVKLYTPLR